MPHAPLGSLLRHLRRFHELSSADATDGELLHRHLGGDEAAFETLVHRHAPLVWGVCRRLLDNEQDAEDAFQAAFLVLLRKADALRLPQSLAAFLHGVASRIARKARVTAQRRRHHEARAETATPSDPFASVEQNELRELLDAELERLPEKYRAPLVLCYLEGKTYAEAARQLGWKEGTVCGRLARAREMLRQRLSRRGVTLSGAALLATLTETSSAPATVMTAAVRMAGLFALGQTAGSGAVAALAQGVLQAMTVAKLKTMAMLVAVLSVCVAGAGWTAHWVLAEKPTEPKPAALAPRADTTPTTHTDVYGDPLPEGVRVRMGTIQLRHNNAQVMFSADGRTLISCGQQDGLVRYWSLASGRLVREMQLCKTPREKKECTSVALGGRCAALKIKDTVILRDVESGEERGRLPLKTESVRGLTPSGDGKFLLVESDAGPNHTAVELWDVAQRKKIQSGKYEFGVWKAVFSPNGKRLALKTGHQDLRLWDTDDGKEIHTNGIGGWALCFSPDGKSLAVNDLAGPIRLLDASTLKEQGQLKRPKNHIQTLTCLEYFDDGRLLAALSNKEIIIWDAATRKVKHRRPEDRASRLAFALDGRTMACWGWQLGSEICLWDLAAGKKLHARPGHGEYADVLAVSPDGKTIASGALHDPSLHVWDAVTGRLLTRLKGADEWMKACVFCADGKHIVSGGSGGTLQLWDVVQGKELRRLDFAKMLGLNFALSLDSLYLQPAPDGKRLSIILIGEDAFAAVWDLADDKVLSRRPYHVELHRRDNPGGSYETWTESHVAFTPDGQSVTVKNGQLLVIEDLRRGRILTRLPEKTGRPVAFAPDGQVLAAAALQPKKDSFLAATMVGLRLIESATGQEVASIKTEEGHLIAFSPDGRLLATADKESIHIWDMATSDEFFRRSWPKGVAASPDFSPATSLAFLPDGCGVATGMHDGTVLIWDVPARRASIRMPKLEVFETLWSALAGEARKAHAAVYALAATPKATLSFLAQRVKPAAEVEEKHLTKLLADLDSDQFEVRQQAETALTQLCDDIEPALRRFLESKPSLEARRRIEAILASPRLVPSSAALRTLRAIRVMETIGTAEARQVLEKLAKGAPAARPTREAKAALQRLTARKALRD